MLEISWNLCCRESLGWKSMLAYMDILMEIHAGILLEI